MSHVISIEMENILDLDALEACAPEFGMELVRDAKSHRWWGHSVGDYPVPAGFKANELGHCEHKLRLKDNPNAYEIGLYDSHNGKPGFQLVYDFYGSQGQPLKKAVGAKGEHLKAAYAKHVAINHWQKRGYRVSTEQKQDGKVVVRAVR
jgi:hypothetical protein